MHNPWEVLLRGKKLSQEEKLTAQRFYSGTSQAATLSFSRLLKRLGYEDEALEVLSLGIKRYPAYSALRVQLSVELFHRGLIEESFNCLNVIADAIGQNQIALPLMFQLALLLRKDALAHSSYTLLKDGPINREKIIPGFDAFLRLGIRAARDEVLKYLHDQRISPIIPNDVLPSMPFVEKPIGSLSDLERIKSLTQNYQAISLSQILRKKEALEESPLTAFSPEKNQSA